MDIDSGLIALHTGEEQYLKSRGWTPALYHTKGGDIIRVWSLDGLAFTHQAAMRKQKRLDLGKWQEMDRVAAELLPTKYGITKDPLVE